jgi:isopenicillin-N N-acyltransferase-like protein
MTLALKRIDNTDLVTDNVGRMVDFYHGVLGLPFHFPYQADQEWAAIDAGNLTIYVFKSGGGEHAARRPAAAAGGPPGIDSFTFEVDDLDEAIAALDGKVEWLAEVREWRHVSGAWYRFRAFYDPDGNKLSVTEPHRA